MIVVKCGIRIQNYQYYVADPVGGLEHPLAQEFLPYSYESVGLEDRPKG